MQWGRWLRFSIAVFAGVFATARRGAAAEPPDASALLALRPFDATAPNAVMRWQEALATMQPLSPLDQSVLETLPDEPPNEEVLAHFRALIRKRETALSAFAFHPGESAQVPPGFGLGRGLAAPGEWRKLAQLKDLQARLLWWNGDRARATAAAADLIRAGSAAAHDATDLSSWVSWLAVAGQGFDCALWLARQIDVGEDELTPLSAALGAAIGPWPEGAANALRGELAFGFRGAVEHLPDTHDIVTMLDALADFGPPTTPADATGRLGTVERPLLDPTATLELYGEMAVGFINKATTTPTWRHGFFASDFERRSEGWLAELGIFGELAMNRELRVYPEEQLDAIKAALARAENPVGKLLVVLGAPNLDALAFTGIRSEAHRRCVRVLVEWRRHVGRGEDLPVSVPAWSAAGLPAGEVEDPFSGQPLFFDTEKLRVWSVGLDGTNNRGSGDPRENPDGADYWWSLETE
jgi:hypothetical protein